MTPARRLVTLLATLSPILTPACGGANLTLVPTRPDQALIILLPDSETGSTGRAAVSNAAGSRDLARERDATLATANRPPGPVATLSEAEVDRLFGEALSALPPTAQRFTLYFQFESDELTAESRALMSEILSTVKQRFMPEVAVVGHTDTMGTISANAQLGLKRATTVRNLLVAAGLNRSLIDVISHGEAEPLVRTADETPEPRNRRVEIAVR
jgi:outer membrane protein OmpA-like peptidoglycan-associated protein